MLQQAVTVSDDRYKALQSAADDAEQKLTSIVNKKMNFDSNYGTTLMWLQALDKELKTVEELPGSELEHSTIVKVCVLVTSVRPGMQTADLLSDSSHLFGVSR